MSTITAIAPTYQQLDDYEELAQRTADGIDVTLVWRRDTNAVAVLVVDSRTGEEFSLPVPAHRALDAFHHPYAYAQIPTAA